MAEEIEERKFFAQRGEDRKILLYLGLGDSAAGTRGKYIDIGAWEPKNDSVTKHFYDNGWRGVNIEPVPYYHDMLKAERIEDLNLQIAVGSTRESKEFTWIKNSGLSTFVNEYSDNYQNISAVKFDVEVWPLRDLYAEFNLGGFGIFDFMKIDVEGWEREVILGNDWTRLRPKLLVIEATVPGTTTPSWDPWDHLIIEAGYDFLEFDGLNRYYRAHGIVLP